MNKVLLLGNLGADPEFYTGNGGFSVLKFRMATNESYFDRKADCYKSKTEWHRVNVFGGEALTKKFHKGDKVFVEGSLHTTSYMRDGEKRYSTQITATTCLCVGSRDAIDVEPQAAEDYEDPLE